MSRSNWRIFLVRQNKKSKRNVAFFLSLSLFISSLFFHFLLLQNSCCDLVIPHKRNSYFSSTWTQIFRQRERVKTSADENRTREEESKRKTVLFFSLLNRLMTKVATFAFNSFPFDSFCSTSFWMRNKQEWHWIGARTRWMIRKSPRRSFTETKIAFKWFIVVDSFSLSPFWLVRSVFNDRFSFILFISFAMKYNRNIAYFFFIIFDRCRLLFHRPFPSIS